MSVLSLKNIKKVYPNGVEAVRDFNLEANDGDFIIFVGPSGCGKSTTLRMIAGLEDITEGEVRIDGVLMNDVEPKDRDIAMIFQNYALYPHMSVEDNMSFGLTLRKVPKEQIYKMVKEAARILDLDPLVGRKPKDLSGGQRQRVAMGRAIVRHPKIFLMDEPLSNLDAKLRAQMRVEIARLHQKLGTITIFVTHDQTEAMTLGTKIVVMNEGLIQQADTPQVLYDKPANLFVAGFIGSPQMNFLNADIKLQNGSVYLQIGEQDIVVPSYKSEKLIAGGYENKEAIIGIRPEDIIVFDAGNITAPGETDKAIIRVYELLGAEAYIYFDIENTSVTAKVNPRSSIGGSDMVKFRFNPEKIHIFDKQTQEAII